MQILTEKKLRNVGMLYYILALYVHLQNSEIFVLHSPIKSPDTIYILLTYYKNV